MSPAETTGAWATPRAYGEAYGDAYAEAYGEASDTPWL